MLLSKKEVKLLLQRETQINVICQMISAKIVITYQYHRYRLRWLHQERLHSFMFYVAVRHQFSSISAFVLIRTKRVVVKHCFKALQKKFAKTR